MPNGMHFNFMRLILDTLRTYSTQVTAYDAALQQMELALQAEGRSIGIQRGSEYTPVLKGALAACESLYTHLRQLVSGYAGLSHRNEYQAAVQLQALFVRCPFNRKWKYGQKMGCMSVLLTQLQLKEVQPLLQAVGVEDVVEELAVQFARAQQVFLARTQEYAERKPAALRRAREVTDAAYEECVQLAQALYRVTGDETLRQVLAVCNEEIERTLQELLGRRSSRVEEVEADAVGRVADESVADEATIEHAASVSTTTVDVLQAEVEVATPQTVDRTEDVACSTCGETMPSIGVEHAMSSQLGRDGTEVVAEFGGTKEQTDVRWAAIAEEEKPSGDP